MDRAGRPERTDEKESPMTKKLMTAATVAVVTLGASPAHAQPAPETTGETSWVHVRVDEADGARVNVNLPVSLVEVALEVAGKEAFDRDDLRLDPDGDVTLEDLRRLWGELRDVGDAEIVEVRDGDEHVRVFRRGGTVHVQVDEGGRETVRVQMPASIVDALLGTEGDELDLEAAVRELARTGNQEVVRVDDEGTSVRVWVDRDNRGR